VVVEAAVARFVGRPLEENPFDSFHGAEQHEAWRWGWRYADLLLDRVGAYEAARWLEEAS
jgi:hypothetical protein